MTTATVRNPNEADDFATDATTTMGTLPRQAQGGRTVEPTGKDTARLSAFRGRRGWPLAWSHVTALDSDTRFTSSYDLVLDFGSNEDAMLAQVERITSSSPEPRRFIFCVASGMARPMPEPRTALGRRLMEIRHRIVASGQPLLDWNGLEQELRNRRGRELLGDDD